MVWYVYTLYMYAHRTSYEFLLQVNAVNESSRTSIHTKINSQSLKTIYIAGNTLLRTNTTSGSVAQHQKDMHQV